MFWTFDFSFFSLNIQRISVLFPTSVARFPLQSWNDSGIILPCSNPRTEWNGGSSTLRNGIGVEWDGLCDTLYPFSAGTYTTIANSQAGPWISIIATKAADRCLPRRCCPLLPVKMSAPETTTTLRGVLSKLQTLHTTSSLAASLLACPCSAISTTWKPTWLGTGPSAVSQSTFLTFHCTNIFSTNELERNGVAYSATLLSTSPQAHKSEWLVQTTFVKSSRYICQHNLP